MAASPIFIGTPKFANIVLNATNAGDPAYINPTTVATVLTLGTSGGRIDTVYFQSGGTNASCVVRLWIDTVGTGGVLNRLIHEEPLAAATSTGVATTPAAVWQPRITLPANAVLRATCANTAVTNGVVVSVEYGEF